MRYTVNVNRRGTYQYKEGINILHKENGPAIERVNGDKEWYIDGKLHREDGPAAVLADGSCEYWQDNKRHRLDGPAVINDDGSCEYWENGKRHRLDGPAVIRADGTKEFWLQGCKFAENKFHAYLNAPDNPIEKTQYTIEELREMSLEDLHKLIS